MIANAYRHDPHMAGSRFRGSRGAKNAPQRPRARRSLMAAVALLVSRLAHGRATAFLRLDSNPPPPLTPCPTWQALASKRDRGAVSGARKLAISSMHLSGCWRPPGRKYGGCAAPGWSQMAISGTLDAHALGCARWCVPRGCERLVRGARGSRSRWCTKSRQNLKCEYRLCVV